jgi:two-component system response regulator NreC
MSPPTAIATGNGNGRAGGTGVRPVQPVSVVLIGEHNLLRAFLRAWLTRFNRMQVVGEATNGRETMEVVLKCKPSLALMDFDTLQTSCLDVLTKLRMSFPRVKVIIYFAHTHDAFAIKLIRAGAAGFVLKSAESEDMESAIKTVMSGGVYLSSSFLKSFGTAVLRDGVPDKDGKTLSPRRAEVLKLIALGMSTKAVAFELKISAKTVDVHRQTLMKRLGVASTTGLVKYAIRSGLVPA